MKTTLADISIHRSIRSSTPTSTESFVKLSRKQFKMSSAVVSANGIVLAAFIIDWPAVGLRPIVRYPRTAECPAVATTLPTHVATLQQVVLLMPSIRIAVRRTLAYTANTPLIDSGFRASLPFISLFFFPPNAKNELWSFVHCRLESVQPYSDLVCTWTQFVASLLPSLIVVTLVAFLFLRSRAVLGQSKPSDIFR